MNKYDEQVLTMFRQANQFMTDNATAITATGVVIIGATNTAIADDINLIDAALPDSAATTIFVTAAKEEAKLAVALSASNVAAAVYAYAINAGIFPLRDQMRPYIAISNLSKLKDEELNPVAQNIHAEATAVIADLEDFGVEAVNLTALAALIVAYEAKIESVYNAIEARKTVNETIQTLFDSIRTNLNLTDALFTTLLQSYAELATGYFNARNIFDPVTTHTKIKGNVTAVITGLPIQGVKVTAIAQQTLFPGDTIVPPIIVFTDALGDYSLKTPKFKYAYTVIWHHEGYEEQQDTEVFVERGKTTTIDIILEPVVGP